MRRLSGRRYANLCAELYLLALDGVDGVGPARGFAWERTIATTLAARGYPAKNLAAGVCFHGITPASGLRHQIDGEIHCRDALVVGEWKAYRGAVPKNEILRFKGVTDDLFDGMRPHGQRLPLLRLFGVAGDAGAKVRWYAARHGITLVEQSRWPAPVLADPHLRWPLGSEPSTQDIGRLQWLSRPMQDVYPPGPGMTRLLLPPPPREAISAAIDTQDRLSEQLWRIVENDPHPLIEDELGLAA